MFKFGRSGLGLSGQNRSGVIVALERRAQLRGLAGIRAKWDTMQSFVKMLALIPVL